ncbi:MAG: hypothetical protein AAF640_02660 [Pseudomonadota bacterium]
MGLSTQLQLAAYALTVAALGFGSPMPVLVTTVSGYAELTSADSDTGIEYVFLEVRNIGASISETDRRVTMTLQAPNAIENASFAGPKFGVHRQFEEYSVGVGIDSLVRGHSFLLAFQSETDYYRGLVGHLGQLKLKTTGPAIMLWLFPPWAYVVGVLALICIPFALLVFNEHISLRAGSRCMKALKAGGKVLLLVCLTGASLWTGATLGVLAETTNQVTLCEPQAGAACERFVTTAPERAGP